MKTFTHFSRAMCWIGSGLMAASAMAQESGKAAGDDMAEAVAEQTNVRVFLLHETGFVKAGETSTLALHFVINPEWHMYWNGYAEDGMEPKWEFQLPAGVEVAGEVVWLVPHRSQPSEFVVEHVYEDSLTLLIPIRVSDKVPAGEFKIGVKAKWLVCSDRCVPESGEDAITLRVGDGEASKAAEASAGKAGQDSSRPSQAAAGKIIEKARRDLERLLALSGDRAKELGITAAIERTKDGATLQLRGGSQVTTLTWFPNNECSHPTSEFGEWTKDGASLDVPLKVEVASSGENASDSSGVGKPPETTKNHSNSVCVRGILQVKTRDDTHNTSEYFVVHLKGDAGK